MTESANFRWRLRAATSAFKSPPPVPYWIYCDECGKRLDVQGTAPVAIGRCTFHSERPGIETYKWGDDLASLRRWDFEKMSEAGLAGAAIDASYLRHQREWSLLTFGPGERTLGVLDHIRKELEEVEAEPSKVSEWADVLILAFDGALRAGHEPQAVIDAVIAKQAINEKRTWPDWRTMGQDIAIEHDRSGDD